MSEKQQRILLQNELDTERVAANLSRGLQVPQIIGLAGALGAGKTTFIRGVLRALGVKGAIKSPTFALVESYPLSDFVIHHFDLYRLSSSQELESLGFREYFSEDAICFIEWPDKVAGLNSYLDMLLSFEVKDVKRQLLVNTFTPSGETLLPCFQKKS